MLAKLCSLQGKNNIDTSLVVVVCLKYSSAVNNLGYNKHRYIMYTFVRNTLAVRIENTGCIFLGTGSKR